MGDGTRFSREISGPRACSRLSDSGEYAKVKGTRKIVKIVNCFFTHEALKSSYELV